METVQRLILRTLAWLPLPVLYLLGDLLYLVVFHVARFERALAWSNLRRAFPDMPEAELRAVMRRSYRNLISVLMEVIKAQRISPAAIRRRVTIVNPEFLDPYLADGGSLIALAAHQCNWEWLLLAASQAVPVQLDAVYKPIKKHLLDDLLHASRTRFGAHLIPARQAFIEIMQRRRLQRIIAMVADQGPHADEDKYWSRFLGQDTAFYPGAEKIAELARLPVIFIGMRRIRRGHYEIRFEPVAAPPYEKGRHEVMEGYIQRVEEQIRQSPEDWLWIYKRWKYQKPLYG